MRIETFQKWLQNSGFLLVIVRSGGQAMGMLRQGGTEAIAGVLLDHDLTDATYTEADLGLSTTNVLPLLIQKIKHTAPILIHSHNISQPIVMERKLVASGFSVTRIRFDELSEGYFNAWLEEVRDNWDP